MWKLWAGCPGNPCQLKPHTKYVRTATEKTQRDDIIECAAPRERPRPVLIRARPAAAKGTSKIKSMQRVAELAGKAEGGPGISRVHLADGRAHESPAPVPR